MLKLYQILTTLAAPLIGFYLYKRKLNGKEDPVRFQERLGNASIQRPQGQLIWIHAASVGESISVLPLIEKLGTKYTNANFLITTGTVTSAKLIATRMPPRTIHQFVPVDRLLYVRRFLKHWQPDLALWVESELWPSLVTEVAKICPLILINGRMSEGSFGKWQKYGGFIKQLLSSFSLCLAQSQPDADRLIALGAGNVKYAGNIKYDAPPLQADNKKLAEISAMIGSRPVWVAASTHKGEELIIANVHKQLKVTYPNLLTIIIPRHPTRGEEVFNEVVNIGLEAALRSHEDKIADKTEIYIADTMGELGIFYRLAKIVFIGGSLVEHGGQNPLEPARLGCVIIVGAHTFNFTEIKREFTEKNAIITVNNQEELQTEIATLFENNERTESLIKNALELVQEKNNILDNIIGEIAIFVCR